MVAGADKRFMACDATYDTSFRLGKISEGIEAAQASAKALALFDRERWLLTEAECSQCPWLHFCSGTCMAKAQIQHGTVKAVDDFECAVRKQVFPALFGEIVSPESRLLQYYLSCNQIQLDQKSVRHEN